MSRIQVDEYTAGYRDREELEKKIQGRENEGMTLLAVYGRNHHGIETVYLIFKERDTTWSEWNGKMNEKLSEKVTP